MFFRKAILSLALVLIFSLLAESVSALPLFARRHQVSCVVCHTGFPQLNSFGAAFAGNGYRFPGQDLKDTMIELEEGKLYLPKQLPLAIRADGFLRGRSDTDTKFDLEAPFAIKLLSSSPLTQSVSYYFYFLFDERGDVTGIEDAFLFFNDAYQDVDLDLRIGQYQVTDVLFAREQRLTFQDYTYYTTSVSDSGFDLTYDRAAEMSYNFSISDAWDAGLLVGIANGNGIPAASKKRTFDTDTFKNFYGKVSLDYEGQHVGLWGYTGREKNPVGVLNEFFRAGPDFNFTLFDSWNLWGNFLYGEDRNPTFIAGPHVVIKSWGGFAGLTRQIGDDWILSLLYNIVDVNFKPELDEETMTVNLTYYLMRNFKILLEFTGDLKSTGPGHPAEEHTAVAGIVFAY